MDNRNRVGKWYAQTVCTECKAPLSFSEEMHSDGICPKCGWADKSTVCSTQKMIIRRVYTKPWYYLLAKPFYEGRSRVDQAWLKLHLYRTQY